MTTAQGTSRLGSGLRTTFGVVLFVGWGIETILWVYDAFHSLIEGQPSPAIRALVAILLMLLLAGMEGLEVAVIDRWRDLFPGGTTAVLAGWLAARQLFVALIVTAATILAGRASIAIPFSSTKITSELWLGIFNLTWTGFTVLWFMQILPKHLAAKNPDRYLSHTRRSLFPFVKIVQASGVYKPGSWVAGVLESRMNWHAEPTLERAPGRRGVSLADAWAALTPENAQSATRRPPDDRPTGST
jgi:hypothetical protein